MKILIDISEDTYNDIESLAKFPTYIAPILRDIIKNGKVLPLPDFDTPTTIALLRDIEYREGISEEEIKVLDDVMGYLFRLKEIVNEDRD